MCEFPTAATRGRTQNLGLGGGGGGGRECHIRNDAGGSRNDDDIGQ